jgi:hypothetical protein
MAKDCPFCTHYADAFLTDTRDGKQFYRCDALHYWYEEKGRIYPIIGLEDPIYESKRRRVGIKTYHLHIKEEMRLNHAHKVCSGKW